MMIKKITVVESHYKGDKLIKEEREYTREDYSGGFDDLILGEMSSWDIKNYAEENCDMINEDDVPKPDISDFTDFEIEEEAEERGFFLFKTQSITEAAMVKDIKEELNF
ncbi:hypothetical protein RM553_12805 [Zunongwangia sp. F363]|uniref:Uncharacterized protein n=1 Tax=Autumnicola tepida TaxID=3075595 RepID=A0ABU3CBK5_9FLAO|nr:hypothetical protein [Zunongwangia sp. F363]MDT0643715.1 hypothetical protein [Zunongwangia sp. F363]